MSRLPIVVPHARYECTRCGECCRRAWTVGIDPQEMARFSAIDWGRHEPRLANRTLFQPDGRAYTIAREADGACVFLDAQNLCVIHRVLGLEQKPQTCRSFPYNYLETPDDVRVSLSWATRGRREAGEISAVELAEIESTYERDRRSNAIFHVHDREVVAFVDVLRRFARSAHPSNEDARLIAIKSTIDQVTHHRLDQNDHRAVESHLDRAARDSSNRDERSGATSNRLRARLGALIFAPVVLTAPVRDRRELAGIFFSLARSVGLAEIWPPHLARGVAMSSLARVRFSPDDRESWLAFLDELLLDGLMVEPAARTRYIARVITLYAFARWLAKLSAVEGNRTIPNAEDLRWARSEAQSFTGPHRGPAGRIARRLSRLSTVLYDRPHFLSRLLAAEP